MYKKRALSIIILSVFILVSCLPAVAFAEETTPSPSAEEYTVTFDTGDNGTFLTNGAPPVQYIASGEDAEEPSVVPDDGYVFAGWDASIKHITGDLTITAQYVKAQDTKVSLTILTKGSGTVSGIGGQYKFGTQVDLTGAQTTPGDGYTFDGFTDSNGNTLDSVILIKDCTLTAVFTAKPQPSESSATPSLAVSPSPSKTAIEESIPETAVPQAAPAASGFSAFLLIPIIGLPCFLIVFFIVLYYKKKKEGK